MPLQSALLALLLAALSLAPETVGFNVTVVSPSKLPPFISRCSIKDPQLGNCIAREGSKVIPIITKGIPQMRLPSLDPMYIDEILIETGRRPSTFRMFAKDIHLTGLTQATLHNVKVDFKDQAYTAIVRVPLFVAKGDYEIDGKILVFPITGKGNFTFTFHNAAMDYKSLYTLRKRSDGRVYHEFVETRANFTTELAHFEMANLFNGDKLLSEQIHTFANENWRDVIAELGQPFVDAAVQIIDMFSKQLSKSIPYDELLEDIDLSTLEKTQKVIT